MSLAPRGMIGNSPLVGGRQNLGQHSLGVAKSSVGVLLDQIGEEQLVDIALGRDVQCPAIGIPGVRKPSTNLPINRYPDEDGSASNSWIWVDRAPQDAA